jgi:hypothetical protein
MLNNWIGKILTYFLEIFMLCTKESLCSYNCVLFLFVKSKKILQELPPIKSIIKSRVLVNLGDSVTTDHISPAGSIARNSAAARYLANRG